MPTVEASTSFLQTIDVGLRGLLYTKFNDILNLESINKGVILYPREIALREMAEKRGQPEVEMINLWRTRIGPDWSRMRTPAARRGMQMKYVNSTTKADMINIKAIPVALEYDVWFWTHYRERLNQIAERYLFWQQDDPNLNMEYVLKSNKGAADEDSTAFPVELDLHFGDMVDESTVAERFDKGQIFILRTPIKLDGWAFVATTVKTVLSIILTVYDKDDLNTAAEYEEVIVEDSDQDTELELALKLFTKTYTST